jgi:hypothetical protein
MHRKSNDRFVGTWWARVDPLLKLAVTPPMTGAQRALSVAAGSRNDGLGRIAVSQAHGWLRSQ